MLFIPADRKSKKGITKIDEEPRCRNLHTTVEIVDPMRFRSAGYVQKPDIVLHPRSM